MSKLIFSVVVSLLFFVPFSMAQKITFSDVDKADKSDLNFEVIGKMNNTFLVYKNVSWRHRISIFDNNMKEVESVKLDFIPEKTFNIDFVAYSNYFYMVYQYQKKNILHCMAVKMDAAAKKLSEPIEIDTTKINFFADNKIYTTIASENKEKIMVFKLFKKNDDYTLATKLYDKDFNLQSQHRKGLAFDDRRDVYDNFLIDNEGNLIFTKETKQGNRDNSNHLSLNRLNANSDSVLSTLLPLDNNYIDNANLKIDNLNGRYLLNSFYYKKSRGNIDGLYTYVWDKNAQKQTVSSFIELGDSLRYEAKREGQLRYALNDFFIRQIVVKKDGGFLLMAEDYSTQTRGNLNSWNRWDYLNSPYSSNSYYYNPYYGYYRPSNNFNNQSTRYYYSNILTLSISKDGVKDWSSVVQKDQFDDEDDNFLSFSAIPLSGEIHFLFNNDRKYQIISDQSINAAGVVKRNATLKSEEKGHQFMPRYCKQVGAKQLIIPCNYRGFICFAKIDL